MAIHKAFLLLAILGYSFDLLTILGSFLYSFLILFTLLAYSLYLNYY